MKPGHENFLIINALGQNQLNLVSIITSTCANCGCQILDSRMTKMGQSFSIMMLLTGSWNAIAKMEAAMPSLEEKLFIRTLVQRTLPENTENKSLPYSVGVVAVERPGILYEIADFFTSELIPIEDIYTDSYVSSKTNTQIFTLSMLINVPEKALISSLREKFLLYCEDRNLDASLEYYKN